MPKAKCALCNAELSDTEMRDGITYWCSKCVYSGAVRKSLDMPKELRPQKAEKPHSVLPPSDSKSLNVAQTAKPEKALKANACPRCGGSARGRGYAHLDGCPSKRVVAKREVVSMTNQIIDVLPPVEEPKPATCPQCGGPLKGRGYTHVEGSACRPVKEKRFCPVCNGPARGRGFIHEPGCSAKNLPES